MLRHLDNHWFDIMHKYWAEVGTGDIVRGGQHCGIMGKATTCDVFTLMGDRSCVAGKAAANGLRKIPG